MNIHLLQHVPFEEPAYLKQWAEARGDSLTKTRLYANEALPALDSFELLIVLGGPMSVGDLREHPWLTAEKHFLEESVRAGRRIVGICLGAQLLAEVLGAKVKRNRFQEIGWLPVEKTRAGKQSPLLQGIDDSLVPFHWHGDTFDLPSGARLLFRSMGCENQAFLVGQNLLGLQFHLESTPEAVRALLEHSTENLEGGALFVQRPETIAAEMHRTEPLNLICSRLLENFLALGDALDPPVRISWEDFEAVDIRIGTVVAAEPYPLAKKPAYKLQVDLGELGIKRSSAQLTKLYRPEELVGTQVVCVVNFPPRQIGPFVSEVLVTGFEKGPGEVALARCEFRVENGKRLF